MADTKISGLTNLAVPVGADLIAVVDDVAGTPATKKATLTNLFGNISSSVAITIPDEGDEQGLVVTQNDTTNNPVAATFVSTAAENVVNIDANGNVGTNVATDGALHIENTGNTGIGLGVYTNIGATASAALVHVKVDNTAFDQRAVKIDSDSESEGALEVIASNTANASSGARFDFNQSSSASLGVYINDENTNGNWATLVIDSKRHALLIRHESGSNEAITVDSSTNASMVDFDQDVTNTNWSNGSFKLTATSVVNDAGTYTKSGAIVSITSEVTETSGTITDSAIILDINQTHADATGNVVDISNDGTGHALSVVQNTSPPNSGHVVEFRMTAAMNNVGNSLLFVESNAAQSASSTPLVRFLANNNTWNSAALSITQEGNGVTISAEHNDTGTNPTIDLDRNGNNAAKIWGMKITVDNAGAGGVGGIDFSGMTTDEAIIKAVADAITSAGTVSHQIPIDIGGTIYYLVAHTHGS